MTALDPATLTMSLDGTVMQRLQTQRFQQLNPNCNRDINSNRIFPHLQRKVSVVTYFTPPEVSNLPHDILCALTLTVTMSYFEEYEGGVLQMRCSKG